MRISLLFEASVLDMLHVHADQRAIVYPNLGKTIMDEAIDDVARYLVKDTYLCWLLRQELRKRLKQQGLVGVPPGDGRLPRRDLHGDGWHRHRHR